jgi:hypothetical protein
MGMMDGSGAWGVGCGGTLLKDGFRGWFEDGGAIAPRADAIAGCGIGVALHTDSMPPNLPLAGFFLLSLPSNSAKILNPLRMDAVRI